MSFKTVLIVDDSETEQFLYKYLIEAFQPETEILSAYDGLEAMELLEGLEKKPDCIFLDINMPRMNGFEFLEAYSEKYGHEHIILTMLTSSTQAKDKEKAMAYECVTDFFLKPLTEDDLKKVSEMTS